MSFQENIIEKPSKHRGYVETGPGIWLRPESMRITEGEEKQQFVNSPTNDGRTLFYVDEYLRKDAEFKKGNLAQSERALAGWTPELQGKWQAYLEENSRAKSEGRSPKFAGLIEPTEFATLKAVQTVVQVFTKIQEDHVLLDTVRVINVDDLNGVAIYDVSAFTDDIVQRQGTHTLPYEVPAPSFTKSTLEPQKYGWRVAFSDEFALVNFQLPNVTNLITGTLGKKIDQRRNKDIAAIINAVGNSGSQANWKTLNTGETRFVNSAFDDVKELLDLINAQGYGGPEFVGMTPDVWYALYNNLSHNQVTGLTTLINTPYEYNNSFRRGFPLFPGLEFVVDTYLTTNRIFTWRRDAIYHLFGGVRVVPFENREIGYSGQTIRTYFNTAKIKSELIAGGTGLIS